MSDAYHLQIFHVSITERECVYKGGVSILSGFILKYIKCCSLKNNHMK